MVGLVAGLFLTAGSGPVTPWWGLALLLALWLAAFVLACRLLWGVPNAAWGAYSAMSMATFSTYALDKRAALRGEAATERLPLSEIVLRILKAHPEGIHFVTLFTEVNVVRRVRRAALASILSSQRYFAQTTAESGLWIYDEKRAAKTRTKKKTGPRRVREWDDDDDSNEEFEFE